ncbi:hypothetical protein VaNZ11_005849 [Volvox africanus]|uniref:MYB transcription factor n=1 Tax=Volvox africanus TaxID=51714 RepID=A0ABQ5S112_9CHLO|nr:hypothetical protein VaNZ11_005849 [Volvox africanus]
MGEVYEEQLGMAQEDLSWEPHEAHSGPAESSDGSDAPAARRGPGAGRSHGPGLPRKRQQRPEWSRHEEEVFVRQHYIRGNSWSAIAEHLPGRTAAEVKNIWHSTLRSKHLKSRSLLRTYALEVQERGDSPEAREEAFRVARLTCGTDEPGTDPGDLENNGHREARPSGSHDGKAEKPAGAGSSPHRQYAAETGKGQTAGKGALLPRCRTAAGSSDSEDAASLTSDLSPSGRGGPRANRSPGRNLRQADALHGNASLLQRRRKAGCESQPHLPDFMAVSDTLTNVVVHDREQQRRRSYRSPGDPDSVGPAGWYGPRPDVDAGAVVRGRMRTSGGGGGSGLLATRPPPAGLLEPRGAPLRPVMWQPQQQPRHWPAGAAAGAQVKRPRKEQQQQQLAEEQSSGSRALWNPGEDEGGPQGGQGDAPWRSIDGTAGWAGGMGEGDPHALVDGAAAATPEELARLQVLRVMQSAGERNPSALQEATAGPTAWLSQQLPPQLAQMLAEWQLLVQAKANLEVEEAHRLAMLRHYLATQMQEARHLEGGTAIAAIAAALGELEENVGVGAADAAWRMLEANGAPSRNPVGTGPPFQAAGRRPPPSAIGAPAVDDYYGDHRPPLPLPLLAHLNAVVPHVAGPAPGFSPAGLGPPQPSAVSLKHLSTLLAGSGVAERLLSGRVEPTAAAAGPHTGALEAVAMAAAWPPPGLNPAAVGGPWELGHENGEVGHQAAALGAVRGRHPQAPDESRHGDDSLHRGHGAAAAASMVTALPSAAEARHQHSAKRRLDIHDNALPGSLNGPFTPQANGALQLLPGMPILNGRGRRGTGSLYDPYNPHGNILPSWAAGNGMAATTAVLCRAAAFNGFRALGTRGPYTDGPGSAVPGSIGRPWNDVAAERQQDTVVTGHKARQGRRLQQSPSGGDEEDDEEERKMEKGKQQQQQQKQEQQHLQRRQPRGPRDPRNGERVGLGSSLGVDASESDVAKALLSFSQFTADPGSGQGVAK